MLKLKKTALAAVLGVGCVASAQAWYEGSLGTLYTGGELVEQNAFSLFNSSYVSVNTNVLDWYTFSVTPGVTSATGTLTSSLPALSLGVGFDNLTFSVYEGTYKGGFWDVLNVALPFGLTSVGSFGLLSDGTLSGTFDFNPSVSNYTLVISGVAAGISFGPSDGYTFTLSAVPEPAEYAMLIAGLGVVGMIVRRRKFK